MHTHRRLFPSIAVVVAFTLFLTACSPSQAVRRLQVIVAATEVALPLVLAAAAISGAPLTPALQQQILAYIKAVDGALDQTAAEMQSGEPAAVQASKITGYFAAAAAPNLEGVPANIAIALEAISVAVAEFLKTYASGPPAQTVLAAPTAAAAPVKLEHADLATLRNIQARARALIVQAR